jgi:hypothetical protein
MDALNLSPIDRLLRTGDITRYEGDLLSDARQARRMLDDFNDFNRIVQDPDSARPTLSTRLEESRRFNEEILTEALQLETGKGSLVDVLA